MGKRTQLVIFALLLIAATAWWLYKHRARTLPPLVLKEADGRPVSLDAVRGDKEHLVLVFLMEGDAVSKFSLGLLADEHAKWSQKMAFAGLLLGTQVAADAYAEAEDVPFAVYGLRECADPFMVNELIEAVGSAYGTGAAVYGGTVVVVNSDRKVVLNLSQDDVRQLAGELTDLND